MYNISIMIFFVSVVFFSGCSNADPKEPRGQSVTLSQEDLDHVKWACSSAQMWAAWHNKGIKLSLSKNYEEALYCFNQAMKEWPKAGNNPKIKHFSEPTDTLLQKGFLYLKMNSPKLAIIYFKKFDSYIPNNKYAMEGIKKAEAMLKGH
jgi:tetratricopeptide (TPR) repeat protein